MGSARFFSRLGLAVTVTDLKTKKELAVSIAALRGYGNITYVLGRHRMYDIRRADLIIKNPGVPESSPYIERARKLGKPITNDGALFLELAPRDRLIGVTGTKGKTTTTLLIRHLIGKSAIAVGVPGVSFFDYFYMKKAPRWIVAEFSSFDLEYACVGPSIAVVTSLFADHLNRYRSFSKYARIKMNILCYQQPRDIAFLWQSPSITKYVPKTKNKKIWIGQKQPLYTASWRVAPEAIAITTEIARHVGVPPSIIKKRLATFKAPTGRLEIIARKAGHIFINDTTATNPGSAIHSLEILARTFDTTHPITIITGGEDKKFQSRDIRAYAQAIKKIKIHPIIIPGSFSEKLIKHLTEYETASTMQKAVMQAARNASVVALVPAAASFNMFKNEFDRAAKFIAAVHALPI